MGMYQTCFLEFNYVLDNLGHGTLVKDPTYRYKICALRTLEAADWDWERGDHPQLGTYTFEATRVFVGQILVSCNCNYMYNN